MLNRIREQDIEQSDDSAAGHNNTIPEPANPVLKLKNLFSNYRKPTLSEIQAKIFESDLHESTADRLIAESGYDCSGAYLALTRVLGVEPDFLPNHDLKTLLTIATHSEVLGIDIKRVQDQLPINRPHNLSYAQFTRLKYFIVVKILPLVLENRFPSLAQIFLNEVILPYPGMNDQQKQHLTTIISEVANSAPHLHSTDFVLNKGMRVQRESKDDKNERLFLETKVGEAIENLRSNTRAHHPTLYEKMLNEFKRQGFRAVELGDLAHSLFRKGNSSDLAVQDKVSRLNAKLSKLDLKIVRRTFYSLERADDQSKKS